MPFLSSLLSLISLFVLSRPAVRAQGDASLWPSWVPLAVRSPYLSAWMNTTNVAFNASNVDGVHRPPTLFPQFLQGLHNSWVGLIQIDHARTFTWLGDPNDVSGLNRSVLTNIEITPTRTIMNMTAGPLDLSITFLSPIEPDNPVLQSLPFTYMSLEATSNDGQSHEVQVYSDITGEWTSGDWSREITWLTQQTSALLYHQIDLESPQAMTESNGQIDDGTVFYAMPLVRGLDVSYFVTDYKNALARAIALDQKILTAAAGVSAHYADIVSLAARQAIAGTELTITKSASDPSQWNTSDVKMFMKNVGTDG
ncbi:hypothetical protein EIP86_005885 [Pleurotus ostreatoroseus]|nr:hypothetical protein EIP86_005885 [Pleurotus ostreatoroseus]